MRFHVNEWNKRDKEYNMLIINEFDVDNEISYIGSGYEILILPSKYKGSNLPYIGNLRLIVLSRNGRIIYV